MSQDGQNYGGLYCGKPLLQHHQHPMLRVRKRKGKHLLKFYIFLHFLYFTQVCSTRNWWGRCTSQEEKHTAVWRKPLPYAGYNLEEEDLEYKLLFYEYFIC